MKRLMILITALLLIAGCGGENARIKDTVIKYNALLAEGYRNLNMNSLIQVAMEERATKLYHHMAALGEAGVKMNAKLDNIKFIKIKMVSQDESEVDTEEIWVYSYNDLNSGKSLFENTVTYQLQYKLIRKTDRWLVSDITIKKSVEEKESQHIFRRPGK